MSLIRLVFQYIAAEIVEYQLELRKAVGEIAATVLV